MRRGTDIFFPLALSLHRLDGCAVCAQQLDGLRQRVVVVSVPLADEEQLQRRPARILVIVREVLVDDARHVAELEAEAQRLQHECALIRVGHARERLHECVQDAAILEVVVRAALSDLVAVALQTGDRTEERRS